MKLKFLLLILASVSLVGFMPAGCGPNHAVPVGPEPEPPGLIGN